MKKYIIIAMLFSYSITSLAAIRTDLTQGTITMSGGVMASYDIGYNAKLSKADHQFRAGSSISIGYFLIDNMLFEMGLPVTFAMKNKSTYTNVGISLGTSYFFDIDAALFPYVALNIVPLYSFHAKKFALSAIPAVGLLLSLSESVALDFAIKSDVGIALSSNEHWSFKTSLGYAGIRAFF